MTDSGERLQKVLAAAGFGSRRACEELIAAGRVDVDGHRATLGERVRPGQHVSLDGVALPPAAGLTYLALNKPRGMVTTLSDERGRPCVGDVVAQRVDRVFPVGRLDAESEGLLLLTNDGELANRVTHPSRGLVKVYLAEVQGRPGPAVVRALRAGVELADGPVQVDDARVVGTSGGRGQLQVSLHEGRKHVVRRLLEAVGHPVERLVRTEIGPVHLGGLRPGKLRVLTAVEVRRLYEETEHLVDKPAKRRSDTSARRQGATATSRSKAPSKQPYGRSTKQQSAKQTRRSEGKSVPPKSTGRRAGR